MAMLHVLTHLALSHVPVMLDSQEMEKPVKVNGSKITNNVNEQLISGINECSSNPCHTNAMCTDTSGSYTCSCNAGFSGDGITCQSNIIY